MEACAAAFNQFSEGSFQDFSRDLRKSLSGDLLQLCRTFLKFSSVQNDALKKGVAGRCALTGGSVDAAVIGAERTDSTDSSSGSRSFRSDSFSGQSSSVDPDASVICASVSLTKLAKDISVLAEGDLESTESNSNLRPLGPPRSVVAPLFVPDWASFVVSKRVKKPVATSNLPSTRKKLALGGGEIKDTVPPTSSRSAKPDTPSQSRSSSVSRPECACCVCSLASSDLPSSDVHDHGALVILSNRNDFTGDAFS